MAKVRKRSRPAPAGTPTKKAKLPHPNRPGKKTDAASNMRRRNRVIQARVASALTGRKRLNRGPFTVSSNTAKGEYTFGLPGSPNGIRTPSGGAGKTPADRQRNPVRNKKVKNTKGG